MHPYDKLVLEAESRPDIFKMIHNFAGREVKDWPTAVKIGQEHLETFKMSDRPEKASPPVVIGDYVLYDTDNQIYRVEHDYGNFCYRIGRHDSFCDLVPISQLMKLELSDSEKANYAV